MEQKLTVSRRRSRIPIQTHVTKTVQRQNGSVKEQETPDAVDLSFLQESPTVGGQQRYSAFCKRVKASRAVNFYSFRRHLNGRSSSVLLLLAGGLFLVSALPFFGIYLQPVSSANMATSHIPHTEEYLSDKVVNHLTDDDGRKSYRRASTGTRHFTRRNSAPTTPMHDAAIQDVPRESKNSFLGGKNMETRRIPRPGEDSTAAPYYMASEHSDSPNLRPASESREKWRAAIQGGSGDLHDLSTTAKNTGAKNASFSYLKSIHEANQQLQKPSGTNGVGSRNMRSASTEVYSAFSAEAPEPLEGGQRKEDGSVSLLSTGQIFHKGTLHATEVSLQNLQHDEELNKSFSAGLSFQQLPPPSETTFVPTATRRQPALPQMENVLPSREVANVGGTAGLRAIKSTENTLSAPQAPALGLSPALLPADSQLAQAASPTNQQLLLLVPPAGQSAYGDATSTQTLNTQSRAPSASPISHQQLTPTAQKTSQGSPLSNQGPVGPFSSGILAAGVPNTGDTATVSASGSPSILSPSNVQPATVLVASGATAQPVAAPLPQPPASVATGLPSGGPAATVVFATGPSAPETPTGAAITLPPLPVFTPPVPPAATPAVVPSTVPAGTLSQPSAVLAPLSAPIPASALLAEAAPANAIPILAAPVTAASGQGASEMPAGAPQGISSVSEGRIEEKTRTRLSAGVWGALLPPAALNTEKQPVATNGDVAANQGPTPSGETVAALGGFAPLTCLATCDCFALIIGGFVSLFLCLMSIIIATLLMSRLFSKGLFSMAFFRGGANVILVAAVLGFTTGGLTGGLVRRCWPGALYFGGGLMSFFVALVLLGKRGAAVGALGGLITGGSIGGLASTEALPIALGCVVGLLLGIVLGFAPILRDLKMNTRYIRYGFESRQSSMQRAETSARASRMDVPSTKRLTQRLFSSPSKTSSLRTTASLPPAEDSLGRRAESFPSSG